MKKKLILLTLCTIFTWVCTVAQTQQGIVKTPGRLDSNGKVIAGKRIAGATVQAKGRTAVKTGADGTFSFPVQSNKFFIQSVKKQGYILVDPEAITRQYTYSSNPITLVLVIPTEQADDKLAKERQIRNTLEKKLHAREDEIEGLKAQNKISQEDYRKELQRLYAEQESNEKLIKDMAERYTKIDFDELDEFNLHISDCILNGRLIEADSLLRTKGDINARIDRLNKQHEANVEIRDNLEKSEAVEQKDREDIAQDCYHRFELFAMDHQNDSAAHYLELRAALDTTNVEWQNQAGMFIAEYLADYSLALSYSFRGLQQAIQQYGEESEETATSYDNIGKIYAFKGWTEEANKFFKKTLLIRKKVFGIEHPATATSYDNIGSIFLAQDFYIIAMRYFENSLNIRERVLNADDPDISTSYNHIGDIHDKAGNYVNALRYYMKALEICEQKSETLNLLTAVCNFNIGSTYYHQGNHIKSIEHYNKALAIRENILGTEHPDVAYTLRAIGDVCYDKGNYSEALEYYRKALIIQEQTQGKMHFEVSVTFNKIANTYYKQGNISKAKDYAYLAMGDSKLTLWSLSKLDLNSILQIIPSEELEVFLSKSGISYNSLKNISQAQTKDTYILFHSNVWWKSRKDLEKLGFCNYMTVNDDVDSTSMDGLKGEYYILEFNGVQLFNSILTRPQSTTDIELFLLKDQPVNIVVLKDGVISKHHFEDKIGVQFGVKEITKEERERINQLYEQWKRENK